MVLELRPAHNPTRAYGFVGVVLSLDRSLGVDLAVVSRRREGRARAKGAWKARKVIAIPAEPADPALLPPLLKGFGAVPPLVTDINLSLDDRLLYVSCWGTGELRQYDVSDPFEPRVHRLRAPRRHRAAHRAPADAGRPLNGGAADGGGQPRRPARLRHELALLAVGRAVLSRRHPRLDGEGRRGANGGMAFDRDFFVEFEDGIRPHQVRLQGGDASSDSFCFA